MKLTENPAKNRLLARLIAFILFLFLLLLSSCKTTSNTTAIVPVHSATHDTFFLRKVKYDSIYIDRWQRIERKADTVFYDRVKTEFRYRLLRDTVYKTRTDTIPVVKQVPVVKKERYTPPFTKFLACLGIIALGASVIVLLGKKLKS
uniref:hypothetical protein n=1 Tax=Prevotella sp. TaxID=59823 RepID=UPI003FEE3743